MQKIVNEYTQSAIKTNNYTVSNIRHNKIMSSLRQSKNMTNNFAPRNIINDKQKVLKWKLALVLVV